MEATLVTHQSDNLNESEAGEKSLPAQTQDLRTAAREIRDRLDAVERELRDNGFLRRSF